VEIRLTGLDLKPKTQHRLMSLWEFLRAYASDPRQDDRGSDANTALATHCDALPSRRKLAEMLDIPREQFPHLFSILADAVRKQANG
jgi:hypothetical protein